MIPGATPVCSHPATERYLHFIATLCFRLCRDSEYLRLSVLQCFTNFRSPISSIDHDNGVRWSYITAVICHHHYIWKSRQPGLNRTKPVTLAETPGWRAWSKVTNTPSAGLAGIAGNSQPATSTSAASEPSALNTWTLLRPHPWSLTCTRNPSDDFRIASITRSPSLLGKSVSNSHTKSWSSLITTPFSRHPQFSKYPNDVGSGEIENRSSRFTVSVVVFIVILHAALRASCVSKKMPGLTVRPDWMVVYSDSTRVIQIRQSPSMSCTSIVPSFSRLKIASLPFA